MITTIKTTSKGTRLYFSFEPSSLRREYLNYGEPFRGVFLDKKDKEFYIFLDDLYPLMDMPTVRSALKAKKITILQDPIDNALITAEDAFDLLAHLSTVSVRNKLFFKLYLDEIYLPTRVDQIDQYQEAQIYKETLENFLEKEKKEHCPLRDSL